MAAHRLWGKTRGSADTFSPMSATGWPRKHCRASRSVTAGTALLPTADFIAKSKHKHGATWQYFFSTLRRVVCFLGKTSRQMNCHGKWAKNKQTKPFYFFFFSSSGQRSTFTKTLFTPNAQKLWHTQKTEQRKQLKTMLLYSAAFHLQSLYYLASGGELSRSQVIFKNRGRGREEISVSSSVVRQSAPLDTTSAEPSGSTASSWELAAAYGVERARVNHHGGGDRKYMARVGLLEFDEWGVSFGAVERLQ